jgi:predicted nuclease of predicted toxin-antitoxin system
MRLLLDESLPSRLRRSLPGHSVKTVVEMGWGGVKNGKLLALASQQQFDAFLTADKNLPYQQNLAKLPLAVVVLSAHSNELPHLLPLIPLLEETLAILQPCTYAMVKA